ncbi:hypothetical protein SAMN06297387_1033 [Streptomyces zhaozhouensis]|uniref:Uncharacterized protein n=1 Tax=Streptomyces zhaozhouensis TaxID=1300267 RepID=A0A286DR48_9ACTN|nr:hypothetical protein SAMN06297387_1033 [Streptomyces zhaozhouensis]
MNDEDTERSAEPERGYEPARWARRAAWGSVALVVLAGLVGAWGFLDLEDEVPVALLTPLSAKSLAIVLVCVGGALMGFAKGQATAPDDTDDTDDGKES